VFREPHSDTLDLVDYPVVTRGSYRAWMPAETGASLAPLTNTSPVLRSAWHAVALSEDLLEEPIQVWVVGEPWALVRLDGEVVAFRDQCPHRLAPMSSGHVVQEADGTARLACGYHGWRYDRTGRCDLIPALGKSENISKRAALSPAAEVTEAYGLIWLAPSPAITGLPAFPEWDVPGMDQARSRVLRTPVGAAQLVDNFLDAAHFPFVHGSSFGVTDDPELEGGDVRRDGDIVTASFETSYRDHGEITKHTVTKTVGVSTSVSLRLDLPHATIGILLACLPETATSTRVFKLICRDDLAGDRGLIEDFVKDEDQILAEDLTILERYTSNGLPLDLKAELHTRSDALSIAWRRLMIDITQRAMESA
jgi:phenylpropionate dioxygenase-like ring-hydroxylating dioxygenase large terminal subunit